MSGPSLLAVAVCLLSGCYSIGVNVGAVVDSRGESVGGGATLVAGLGAFRTDGEGEGHGGYVSASIGVHSADGQARLSLEGGLDYVYLAKPLAPGARVGLRYGTQVVPRLDTSLQWAGLTVGMPFYLTTISSTSIPRIFGGGASVVRLHVGPTVGANLVFDGRADSPYGVFSFGANLTFVSGARD